MTEEQMRAILVGPSGLDAARELLRDFHGSGGDAAFERAVRHLLGFNGTTIWTGARGLELALTTPQAPGTLARLVAIDANVSLDDPSDDGARPWLSELLGRLRAWIDEA